VLFTALLCTARVRNDAIMPSIGLSTLLQMKSAERKHDATQHKETERRGGGVVVYCLFPYYTITQQKMKMGMGKGREREGGCSLSQSHGERSRESLAAHISCLYQISIRPRTFDRKPHTAMAANATKATIIPPFSFLSRRNICYFSLCVFPLFLSFISTRV